MIGSLPDFHKKLIKVKKLVANLKLKVHSVKAKYKMILSHLRP